MTFLEKLGALAGSVRFWIIVLTGVLAVLNGAPLIMTIQGVLISVVALGTVDSAATLVGGVAKK